MKRKGLVMGSIRVAPSPSGSHVTACEAHSGFP